MKVAKIGIIGVGVVGHSLGTVFAPVLQAQGSKVYFFDKYKTEFQDQEVFNDCDISFVCVPSQTKADGTQDLSHLHEALDELAAKNFQGVVVIKSTILPGTTNRLRKHYPNLRLVHSPEFLRQATALKDLQEETTLMLSGAEQDRAQVIACYRLLPKEMQFQQSDDSQVTELAKYIHNCFLATKVVWMHEMKKLTGDHFDEAVFFASAMGGIGYTHNVAPGEDGFGYAGACFPKDMLAFANFLQDHSLIHQAIAANSQLRAITPEHTRDI